MHILVQRTATTLVVAVLILLSSAVAGADGPSQIERGQAAYKMYCSTRHGDVGQGLTAEFRATWPPGDQNCWKSKCHADNHPPGGFVFPKTVPALVGPGSLSRFETALQVYTFISQAMPYYAPGLLKSDQYWDLTAFLLSMHAVKFDGILGIDNAPTIRLRPAESLFQNATVPITAAAASVLLIAAGIVRQRRRSARALPRD